MIQPETTTKKLDIKGPISRYWNLSNEFETPEDKGPDILLWYYKWRQSYILQGLCSIYK